MFTRFNYFDLVLCKVVEVFSRIIGDKGRSCMGFNLVCRTVFIYLSLVSVFSIFPYRFCVTCHFSHNFCISLRLWFCLILLNFRSSFRGYFRSLVPRGVH